MLDGEETIHKVHATRTRKKEVAPCQMSADDGGEDMNDQIWLLHLSDIHFNKKKKDDRNLYDLDTDLRDQLEIDVGRVRDRAGRIHGIIVSGDIAFAGRECEYEVAFKWLQTLCEISGCSPEAVFCVPGNHDVDRTVWEKSVNLKNLHNSLRPASSCLVDAELHSVLNDHEAASILFRKLEQYNRFAAKFRCSTSPSALWWEQEIPLNDGSRLRLRGANSTLVSDEKDNNKDRKLILGTLQATPLQRADEAVVFICHHPLDWVIDNEEIIPNLNARARVQLFGHKHLQTVEHTNNCLRIVAGAVHPDRREPRWRPRYNCLGFSVSRAGSSRKLTVEVLPRVWNEHEPKFVPDYALCGGGKDSKVYNLELEPWDAATVAKPGASGATPPAGPSPGSSAPMALGAAAGAVMNPAKTLTYRFLSLSHLSRLEIAQSMKLLRDEDEGLFDAELFERILKRASDESRLSELWDLVEKSHGDKAHPSNPYARS